MSASNEREQKQMFLLQMTLILKKVMNIIKPDSRPAHAAIKGMKFPLNTSTNRETNGYTSGMLMCRNAKADTHNSRRSGKGIQRSTRQYRTVHDREYGYTLLHGLVYF